MTAIATLQHAAVNRRDLTKSITQSELNLFKSPRRFVNEKPLQEGSTAVVSKAYDTKYCQDVALKRMDMDRFTNQRVKEYIVGKAIGDHPNVVTTYEKLYNHRTREVCLVMECCDGGDLVDILASRDQGFDRDEFISLAEQLAGGLSHIHSKGIAHRDIKSDNISLSTEDGQAKILDFGESQFITEPANNLKSGTLPYMAPELVTAIERRINSPDSVDRVPLDLLKTDVWAMGITFYSMITSQIPFAVASQRDSGFRNYLRENILGSYEVWAAVDDNIRMLLENMCELDPVLRWTMDEVVEYLSQLQ
ncbi:CAMK protein kinase [Sphaeroforma arctica JP610]|uniref:CAMK protein kinase n=1 Tax=Sphaeroforma arctica JP610 TaxID=667725 RepID=A0A0L0FHD2_9EUKA|nr:CAMK protein kinase [Sphaeroforma arctica JP610]KNC76182.1 CAMK protein kinase [Sphaeroforma arctica JP610]|eukprot:XP_014150084.1 CAMK protein kinase [Sphaeroforma arctica JP610]